MSSLIPNLGNVSADTSGALRNYLMASQAASQAYQAPIDVINKLNADNLEKKRYDEKMAMLNEEKLYNRGRDARKDKIEDDERARLLGKELATNEALVASMNPEVFRNDKLASERAAMEQSMVGLSPEEASKIRSMYNPEQSGAQWLSGALNNKNVDQSELLKAKYDDLKIKLSNPNSAEFKAVQDAERKQEEWKANLQLNKQLSVLNAQRKYDEAKEDREANKLRSVYEALQTSPYEKVVTNEADIAKSKLANDAVMKKQEEFSRNYTDAMSKFINIKDDDTRHKAAMSYSLGKTQLKEVPSFVNEPSPQYEDKLMPKEKFSKELFSRLDPTSLDAKALDVVNKRVENLYKVDEDKLTANDYKTMLKDKNIDTTGLTTTKGLKAKWDEVIDKESGDGKKSKYGVGAETLATFNNLGVDSWSVYGKTDQEAIADKAKEYKITDSELAKLVKAIDSEGWTPTSSDSIREGVIKAMENYYKKREQ